MSERDDPTMSHGMVLLTFRWDNHTTCLCGWIDENTTSTLEEAQEHWFKHIRDSHE